MRQRFSQLLTPCENHRLQIHWSRVRAPPAHSIRPGADVVSTRRGCRGQRRRYVTRASGERVVAPRPTLVWSSGASDVTVQEVDLIGHDLLEVRVQIGLEVRAVIGLNLALGMRDTIFLAFA